MKNQLPERVYVSTLADYKSFTLIDNEGKELFDFVTFSVWNARKYLVNLSRPLYNCEKELTENNLRILLALLSIFYVAVTVV